MGVDAPAARLDDGHLVAERAGIERGVENAVVGGEASEHDLSHTGLAKQRIQADRRTPVVFQERRVAVDARVDALAKHRGLRRKVEARGESGPRGACNAVVRPEDLLAVGQRDPIKRPLAGVTRGE